MPRETMTAEQTSAFATMQANLEHNHRLQVVLAENFPFLAGAEKAAAIEALQRLSAEASALADRYDRALAAL